MVSLHCPYLRGRKTSVEKSCSDTSVKNIDGNNIKVENEKSQDTSHRNISERVEAVLCASTQSSNDQAASTAENILGYNDGDYLKVEEIPDKNCTRGSSLNPEEDPNLEANGKICRNCLSGVNTDEEVVDISPSGYTASALKSLVEQESGMVSHVQKIFVFDNTFTILPDCLSKFDNLRSLKLFSNTVKVLPDKVGDLVQLEHLQVSLCPTGLGSLPPLGKLNSLKVLELYKPPLRPSLLSLPLEISKLQSLTRLAVRNFSISFLPPEVGDLRNLEELDLSFNRLKVLPKEVSSLQALRCLRVENNRLVELPSELTSLPNLALIDVAHNRLTSLESLGLSSMTSLRVLDAKFNKLQSTGLIPDWLTCNLEGNHVSYNSGSLSISEDDVDFELLPCVGEGENISFSVPISHHAKENMVQKNTSNSKSRRGWKRQDNQQHKARQDRLNISRKSKTDNLERLKDGAADVMISAAATSLEKQGEHGSIMSSRQLDCAYQQELAADRSNSGSSGERVFVRRGGDVVCDGKVKVESSAREDEGCSDHVEESYDCHILKKNGSSVVKHLDVSDDGFDPPMNRSKIIDTHSCRKVISGDRCNQFLEQQIPDGISGSDEHQEFDSAERFDLTWKKEQKRNLKIGVHKTGSLEKNPKPRKRRKSSQNFSEASCTYFSQSLCGFGDRVNDGFYDAGRERSFVPLDVLENEQPSFDTREVILVDRERDEELDVITLSAQQFLAGLEVMGRGVDSGENHRLTVFQKAAILSLFVSDCFGGSDKTLNVSNTRRAAVGGTGGVPFACSCSSRNNSASLASLSEGSTSSSGVVPSVDMLCEGAVRVLKMQRRSNVLPIGSIPYGVCRHRAILFKYLCDRSAIPCELVRGYLDYMPHAWNVILVDKGSSSIRMLVDACRPFDIREERDTEYFCRYIPLKRIHLPSTYSGALTSPVSGVKQLLHEEIGHGASGSVVRRCTLGPLTAAAKVCLLDHEVGHPRATYKDAESKCLSELRILCSLGEHPCIVSFYGHHFSCAATDGADDKGDKGALQLVIFMEYVRGGSLEKMFLRWAKEGRTYMPAKKALYVARDVVHALSLLHSKKILHRDIKSSNVLVNMEGDQGDNIPTVKLCDFDSAVPLSSSSAHTCYLAHRGVPPAEICVGTPRWMAPEVLRAIYGRHQYGLEADIWSYGCFLLELLTLQVPYAGISDSQVQSYIQSGQRPQLPTKLDSMLSQTTHESNAGASNDNEIEILKVIARLYKLCTEVCPSNRPTALEAYAMLSAVAAANNGTGSKISFKSEEVLGAEVASPSSNTLFSKGPITENNNTDEYELCEDRHQKCSHEDIHSRVVESEKIE